MLQLPTALLAAAVLFSSVSACWEQCGGIGWTGSTTCASPCVCTYQNDWYSQCLQASSTVTTSTKATTSSSTSTTSKATTSTTTKATTSSTTTSKATTSTSTTTKSTTSTTSKITTSTASPSSTSVPKYWFAFGDSYTQTGFSVTSTLPSAANVFGNPTYPGYTACGSVPNWIDDMIIKYNSSYIYSYNFAVGGATIDNALVAASGSPASMTDQVNSFLQYVGSKPASTPWTSDGSIFSFFVGINDLGYTYSSGGDRDAFADTLMNAYFALVQKLYNVGSRKFLFIYVPAVDRSPFMNYNNPTEKTVIASYNAKLSAKAAAFKAANSGTTTWVYDSYTRLNNIVNSPATYGFVDATTYGSADNVVWCNNYHVSPKVHDYFAQDIAALLSGSGF